MNIDQSRNAIPFAEKFRSASFRLTEDNLKSSGVELAFEVIHDVREKIAAVNWDKFDPASDEAFALFPVLMAVAATQEDGRDFLRSRQIDDGTLRRFSTGISYPGIYAVENLIRPLKEIVETAIERLEKRLPKNEYLPQALTH